MKALCILLWRHYVYSSQVLEPGIPNWHNVLVHNLTNSQNSTSAVPQVIIHHVPNVHKVPKQYIIYLTYSGWHSQPVLGRLCQNRLHHVIASSPKMLGPTWRVWTSSFMGTWFLVNQCIQPSCTGFSIGQDRPNRLKLGPMVLPTPLCKGCPRLLKSD